MTDKANSTRFENILTTLLSIGVGAVFVFSGLAKAIDPWGFVIKLQEYTNVWHIDVPREALALAAVTLSAVEFTSGIMLAIGKMRRMSLILISAMMCFLLPLSIYISIANPVSDCGCFGDAYVISNTATVIKNIIISAAVVYLINAERKKGKVKFSRKLLKEGHSPTMMAVLSLIYCVALSIIGYNIQPLVDFRPYKTGTTIFNSDESDDTDPEVKFVYEKNGHQQEFSIAELPDSTWTFVKRTDKPQSQQAENTHAYISFYDESGEDMASYELEDNEGMPTLMMLVTEPQIHQLSRSRQANRLAEYMNEHGGRMFAVVACHPDSLPRWQKSVDARYNCYAAEDTQLKEIARGDAALVYLHGDTIKWKRSLYSFSPDFPDTDTDNNMIENIKAIDSGKQFIYITSAYLLLMILLYTFETAINAWIENYKAKEKAIALNKKENNRI